jgi:hypothetical protein
MALNAEVSFAWLGHGTWRVRSVKFTMGPKRVARAASLLGVRVLDIKPDDIV